MDRFLRLALLGAFLLLPACTSGPVPILWGAISVDNSLPVPDSRLYPGAEPDGGPNGEPEHAASGTLIFVRDINVAGDLCLVHLHVNGERRASLQNGERAVLRLPAGSVELKITSGKGLCPQLVYAESVQIAAQREQAYIVRAHPGLHFARVQ